MNHEPLVLKSCDLLFDNRAKVKTFGIILEVVPRSIDDPDLMVATIYWQAYGHSTRVYVHTVFSLLNKKHWLHYPNKT